MFITGLLDHRSYFSIYNCCCRGAGWFQRLPGAGYAAAPEALMEIWVIYCRNTHGGSAGFLILSPGTPLGGFGAANLPPDYWILRILRKFTPGASSGFLILYPRIAGRVGVQGRHQPRSTTHQQTFSLSESSEEILAITHISQVT